MAAVCLCCTGAAAVPCVSLFAAADVAAGAQGPREDSGFNSGVDTGVRLASQLYTYCKKFHPKTQVMASGLRTKDGRQAASDEGAVGLCTTHIWLHPSRW